MAAKTMTYGRMEAALFRFLSIHPDRQDAMRSRMKQWRDRLNFPAGLKVGKGVRAEYGADEYFQYCFLGDLLGLGLTPERGILIIEKLWSDISNAIYDTMVCLAGHADHKHYLSVVINTLAGLQEADHPGKLGYWLQVGGFTSRDLEIANVRSTQQLLGMTVADCNRARRRVAAGMRADVIMDLDSFVATALFALNNYQGVFPPRNPEEEAAFREGVFFMSEGVKKWRYTGDTMRGASLFHDPEPTDYEASGPLPEDPELRARVIAINHSAMLNCMDALGVCSPECARDLEPDAEGNIFNPRWGEPLPWTEDEDGQLVMFDEDDHLTPDYLATLASEEDDDTPEIEEAA